MARVHPQAVADRSRWRWRDWDGVAWQIDPGAAVPLVEEACDPTSGELRYMPLAHPGLLPETGAVVVSYSRNYVDFQQVCAEPTHSRPNFLRVLLPQ